MSDALPFFSVVVPTYRRPGHLARCLGALARVDYPADRWEVVVADDGSPEPVDVAVARGRVPVALTVVRQANAGPAAARNAGAARARGDYLAFTDDDCAPEPGWLRALAARAAAHPGALVGGGVVNALPDNPYSAASELLIAYLHHYYARGTDSGRFFPTNNLAVPAGEFRRLGGYDTRFRRAAAEDREFCDRWTAAGGALVYAPEAAVRHAHRLSLRRFVRQHAQYGRGAPYYHQVRAARGAPGIPAEPLAFYGGLLRFPRASAARRPARAAALLALSQGAYAAGFAWELLQLRLRSPRPRPTAPAAPVAP